VCRIGFVLPKSQNPFEKVGLGEMMINGRGGPAYPAAARELFEKAAAKRHTGAMFALGAMYSGGHNYPVDRAEAQRWFRAAAELGHGQARLMLARYLVSGAAGEKRPAEARTWLERAVARAARERARKMASMIR
jgi:uncharacterized protein